MRRLPPLLIFASTAPTAALNANKPSALLLANTYDAGLSPAPTAPPALELRADFRVDPAMSICGYYTHSKVKEIRTQRCQGTGEAGVCGVAQGFIACGTVVYTTCKNAREAEACQSGKQPGEGTLCCRETSGFVPACQTFMRDDGAAGWRRMLGCRTLDIGWDETVTLHLSTDLLGSQEESTFVGSLSLSVGSLTTSTAAASSPSAPSAASTPTPTTSTAVSAPEGDGRDVTGAIVGGVIGGLAVLGVTICFLVWLLVRRRRQREGAGDESSAPSPVPELQGNAPENGGAKQELEANEARQQPLSPPESLVFRTLPEDALGSPSKPAELG